MHSLIFLMPFDDFEEPRLPPPELLLLHVLVGVLEDADEELPELKFSDLIAGAAVVV
jgi:hypothetical protein